MAGIGEGEDASALTDSQGPEYEGDSVCREEEPELRCVIMICRHGDRTPKQKMKIKVQRDGPCHDLLQLFVQNCNPEKPTKELKLKTARELTLVLGEARKLKNKLTTQIEKATDGEEEERQSLSKMLSKIDQMCSVLEKGGKFSGINRKLQIKPTKWEEDTSEGAKKGAVVINEVLVVAKWGGNLTSTGYEQAEELGRRCRQELYPGGDATLGIHNSYRHDLKIYSSDEGRVQMTAAAFTKTFLDLEGELTPILVSLVSRDREAHSMLDPSGVNVGRELQEQVKSTLREILQTNEAMDEKVLEEISDLTVCRQEHSWLTTSVVQSVKAMGIAKMLAEMDSHIDAAKNAIGVEQSGKRSKDVAHMIELENGETLRLMHSRWQKLYDDIWDDKTGQYDMSKIPDVYDCCKYDAIHSQPSLGLTRLQECYKTAQVLSEFVAPAEYGMTRMQRLDIGSTICRNLMDKIARDIETALPKRECDTDASETDEDVEGDGAGIRINPDFIEDVDFIDDQIKTRLYFTSESHVHGIINSLRYCHYAGDEECSSQPRHEDGQHSPKTPGHQPNPLLSEEAQAELNSVHEFDYLSQIIFKVYENTQVADPADPSRFEVRIGISPGVTGLGQDRQCQPVQWLACPEDFLKCDTFVAMLRSLTARVDRRAHQEPEKRPKVDKSS